MRAWAHSPAPGTDTHAALISHLVREIAPREQAEQRRACGRLQPLPLVHVGVAALPPHRLEQLLLLEEVPPLVGVGVRLRVRSRGRGRGRGRGKGRGKGNGKGKGRSKGKGKGKGTGTIARARRR